MKRMRFSCVLLLCSAIYGSPDFFIAKNGNDVWSGKLPAPNSTNTDGPFASVAKAQTALRELIKTNPARPLTVMLREGTYYLPLSSTSPGTLAFSASDSGTANAPVTWQNYPGETPIISGGEPIGKGGLGLTWTHASGSLWTVQLPAGTQPFGYLFYNGERRLRSRLQSSHGVGYYMRKGSCYSTVTNQIVDRSECDLGTFLRVAAEIPPTGANAGCPSVATADGSKSKCLDRFAYNPEDPIAAWANLNPAGSICGGPSNAYPVGDIEITHFGGWVVDVMRVGCVDTTNHVIYFTGTTKSMPNVYNFFGPGKGHRYIVENTREAFEAARSGGQTGLWFLDRSTSPWTLNYLANPRENPNQDTVVITETAPVSPIGGSLISATNLSYVTFRGITFEMDNYTPPAKGFNNDENSEATLPEAIDCESCQQVTFDGITVRHTSASGILIASTSGNSGAPASDDVIENSAFYDIGSSGIRIGHHPTGSDRAETVVHSVTAQNNVIQGYSRVFADGEGIAQANGHDITYVHNDISDGYHAGISICAFGCPGNPANGSNIVSQYNHIWNIMQGITSDGGTLYYNIGGFKGSGTGNKVLSNLVHDTTDASIIDLRRPVVQAPGSGYGGQGIYLDNHSSGVLVENNVVYRVTGSTAWHSDGVALGQPPNTFRNNIFAYGRQALFTLGTAWHEGCEKLSVQDNITHNIFYFDRDDAAEFHVTRGCAYSCGLDYNQFLNFEGNLYWRTDGKFSSYEKAFHVMTKAPRTPGGCSDAIVPDRTWTFLTFAQWQNGQPPNGIPPAMNEDKGGTVTVNPGFGGTGKPGDYLFSKSPVAGFDHTKTNDTIRNAGRNHPVIMPPKVPSTFPTYTFKDF